MSCCSSITSPKGVAALALRLGFGLSILFIGIAHYLDLQNFVLMTKEGLGPLASVGMVWAYILPALLIVGGILLTAGLMPEVGAWSAGIALGSIAPGLLIKGIINPAQLGAVMPMVVNTLIWLLVYFFVVKSMSCCGSACGENMKK